jgi:hypothetical protein
VFNGDKTITIAVPAAAEVTTSTTTFARFRLSTAGGLAPTGLAADGEVENYAVTLSPCPTVVYVDPAFTGTPGTVMNGQTIGYDAFPIIQQGINAVCTAGTVNVDAETYGETVNDNNSVALVAQGAFTVTGDLTLGGGAGFNLNNFAVTVGSLAGSGKYYTG